MAETTIGAGREWPSTIVISTRCWAAGATMSEPIAVIDSDALATQMPLLATFDRSGQAGRG